jgi:hypothetical protein
VASVRFDHLNTYRTENTNEERTRPWCQFVWIRSGTIPGLDGRADPRALPAKGLVLDPELYARIF